MTWDWKKLLQSKAPPPEEASPAFDPEDETPTEAPPARPGPSDGYEAGPSARSQPAPGLQWYPTGATGRTGGPTRVGRLPELLYGQEHDCAFCRGTGLMKGSNQCPVCRGDGKVSLPPPVVRCGFCHGGGHMPVGSTVTCPVCRGRGVIEVKAPIEICPDCNGRGRQRGHSLYCGPCRGTGVITSRVERLGVAERRSDVA